jgi:hypothetical protein
MLTTILILNSKSISHNCLHICSTDSHLASEEITLLCCTPKRVTVIKGHCFEATEFSLKP